MRLQHSHLSLEYHVIISTLSAKHCLSFHVFFIIKWKCKKWKFLHLSAFEKKLPISFKTLIFFFETETSKVIIRYISKSSSQNFLIYFSKCWPFIMSATYSLSWKPSWASNHFSFLFHGPLDTGKRFTMSPFCADKYFWQHTKTYFIQFLTSTMEEKLTG